MAVHFDDKKTAELGKEPNKPDTAIGREHIQVKVHSPFKTYFDGPALSVSAVNDTGPFDILPEHHNFITLLNAGDIIVRSDRGEEVFTIDRGVMHVKKDKVIVFLDV